MTDDRNTTAPDDKANALTVATDTELESKGEGESEHTGSSTPEDMTLSDNETTYKKIGDPALLDKIDKLFACNVGEYIDLPQLVVVGDQSSGKSSVLEGLTRLPFPRDSGLCTRFATQITFRRAAEKSISVSILPDPDSPEEYRERVKAWRISDIKKLDATAFMDIMIEVQDVMGLDKAHGFAQRKTFSNDVLRLEIHGPEEAHLSVIDVPGIFRKTTLGKTTAADKDLVKDMVVSYMRNPRTVMLAVVPANVDLATQEILEIANEFDPECRRTIGVLTKPDLVDKGAEQKIVELVEGKSEESKFEWSVVRNPGQQDLGSAGLDRGAQEESFFRRTAPWNTLSADRRGINSLRSRLEEVLTQHIRREFPKVRAEINKKLSNCKAILVSLGTERDTADKQSKYLLNLAMRFQQFADLAIKAIYGASNVFDDSTYLRLATKLVKRSEEFSKHMERMGHQYSFDYAQTTYAPSESEGTDEDDVTEAKKIYSRHISNSPDLAEILTDKTAVTAASRKNIIDWLRSTYQDSRGFEMGSFDASILAVAMRQQAKKWDFFSKGYVSDAVALVHDFITKLMETLCADEKVRERLLNILLEGLLEKYRSSLEQVEFLLNVELSGVPMTLNHYFNDNLEKCRQRRMKAAMEGKSINDCKYGTVVPLNLIMENHPMSNIDHTVQDIHDILSSYYKVARKRFVDNVCLQATGYHLVHGPNTPLKLFSPEFVSDLSDEQLEEIAGEDLALKRKRAQLKKEIHDLEAGRRTLM